MSATLVSLWSDVRGRLEAAGVDTPTLDARLLLEAGAGVARSDIVTAPRRVVSDSQMDAVDALVRRREAREPMSHILGRKSFWSIELLVNADVLTPRPETELVVETALAASGHDAPARILDLGAGSGAILLAVLSERPNATGLGIDVSGPALAVARANAERLGLAPRATFRAGNWAEGLDESFDLVVANPPYIATSDISGLAPEVRRYEPRLALDGGVDGLDAYRTIVAALPRLLKPGGAYVLEVGIGQADLVAALLRSGGLAAVEKRVDISGIDRVVSGRLAA